MIKYRYGFLVTLKGAYRELPNIALQINNRTAQTTACSFYGPGAQSSVGDAGIDLLYELSFAHTGAAASYTWEATELGAARPSMARQPTGDPGSLLHALDEPRVGPVVEKGTGPGDGPHRHQRPAEHPDPGDCLSTPSFAIGLAGAALWVDKCSAPNRFAQAGATLLA